MSFVKSPCKDSKDDLTTVREYGILGKGSKITTNQKLENIVFQLVKIWDPSRQYLTLE